MTQLSPGWHSRGYLPHSDGGELAQFITFRLFDSLPKAVLIEWKEDLKLEKSAAAESIMRRRVEAYLDQGHGSCYLKNDEVATMVQMLCYFMTEPNIAWLPGSSCRIMCICSARRLDTASRKSCTR